MRYIQNKAHRNSLEIQHGNYTINETKGTRQRESGVQFYENIVAFRLQLTSTLLVVVGNQGEHALNINQHNRQWDDGTDVQIT